MRFSVIFSYLLIMMIILVSMDATSSAASSAPLVVAPGRRSIGKWSHSYQSKEGDGNVKDLTLDSTGPAVKPKKQDSSKEYSTGTQNSNNVEEIVYSIDYHGATTHPTPTPKHPKP